MSGELQLTPEDRLGPPPGGHPHGPSPQRRSWRERGRLGRRRELVEVVDLVEGPGGVMLAPEDRPATLATPSGGTVPLGEPAVPPRPERVRKTERVKKTWREKRWERRRRRRIGEEVLGWILVPIILASGYWATKAALTAFGTTPTALVAGIKAAISGRGGGL